MKMRQRNRFLTMLVAVMLCMAVFTMPALASAEEPADSITESTTQTNPVVSDENAGTEALTPEGNLTLVDDVLQADGDGTEVENKQFITVQSKNGNTFYIVIDRSGKTENVYFMNLVDEADLTALMEDENGDSLLTCTCTDKCAVGSINTTCPVCQTTMSECTGKEAVPEPEPEADPVPDKSSNSGVLPAILLIVLLAGGGAVYYLKFRKPKPQTKGADDLDDYDYGEEDEPETESESNDTDDTTSEESSV